MVVTGWRRARPGTWSETGIQWAIKLLAMMLSALFAYPVAADTPAFTPSPLYVVPPRNFTGTRGWAFSNGGPNSVTITAVGVWDFGGDGLANSHEVGIWGNSGNLLRSANVPAGTEVALIDHLNRQRDTRPQ